MLKGTQSELREQRGNNRQKENIERQQEEGENKKKIVCFLKSGSQNGLLRFRESCFDCVCVLCVRLLTYSV